MNLLAWVRQWWVRESAGTDGNLVAFDARGLPADSALGLDLPKTFCGFDNRTDTTIAIDSLTGVFTLGIVGASALVYTDREKHVLTDDQTVEVTDDRVNTYIYIDEIGVLQKSTTAWNLAGTEAAPCAIVFKDADVYALTDERHSKERNRAWHSWAHNNIGAMYRSGFGATFGDDSLSIAQGIVADEDICFDSGADPKTTTSLWYRDGAGKMRLVRGATAPYATVDIGDPAVPGLAYENSGTLTSVGGNAYATNWVYASNDPVEPIYTVVSQATYPSLFQARNATLPIINLSTAEWKLLYRVIYRRRTPGGVETISFIESADFRTVQTGVPTQSPSPADHAQLINRDAENSHPASAISVDASGFSGNLEETDIDVQTALETIDAMAVGNFTPRWRIMLGA